MLLTPHTMVGIAIGATVPELQIAVPLSFVMHFAGDLVPHYDPYPKFPTKEQMVTGWRPLFVISDLALGVAVGVFFTLHALWLNNDPYLALKIFLSGIAAVSPDAMHAAVLYFDSKNIVVRAMTKIQSTLHIKAGPIWGNITQLGVTLLALFVALNSLAL